jgi:hypothetical protein
MALVAGLFIVAPDVRMSILAMGGSPMRPYTLTQTDQSTLKIPLANGAGHTFFVHSAWLDEWSMAACCAKATFMMKTQLSSKYFLHFLA